uniref:Uncharacterized protein n=1 Tax=Pithovirus LCPAC403 TaxID=2506596 RepID=A0A481ZD20_9VIRU|nr:MAG: uncharacterized protein LCPAC403_01640 [Pithovirus LCPAC403]
MKIIVLEHLKTLYPSVTDLISYTFDDGVMFIPLCDMNYLYEDLDYVNYEQYRGMTPVVDCGLMRYILERLNLDGKFLGKIVLFEGSDISKIEEVKELDSYLRDEGYFAPNVGSPQHVKLYSELADLWGSEVVMKENDYICFKGGKKLLNYVSSFKEFFERSRDIFPDIPTLLIEEYSIEFTSLYQLEQYIEMNKYYDIETPIIPEEVEIEVYEAEDGGLIRIDVRQDDIFDYAYYKSTVEQVTLDWNSGKLLTDHCKVMLSESEKISFYCLKRET